MAIDTLQLSKDLQDVEFTRGQADALARIFLEHTNGKLREDIWKLEQRLMEHLREEIAKLEQRLMEHLQASLRDFRESLQESVKRDLDQQRVEFKSEIRELKAEIRAGDASTKVDLTKWIVGAIVLNLLGTAGLMITLNRTVPH